jgi:small-conductance mechanosensitive channel
VRIHRHRIRILGDQEGAGGKQMEISVGAAAFWIALAAVLVAGGWWKSRSEAQKHETIRRIVEKTGQVDEVKLKELFEPPVPGWVRERIEIIKEITKTQPLSDAKIRELLQPPPSPWDGSKPGDGYRALRVSGAIIMFLGLGIAIACGILYLTLGLTPADTGEAAAFLGIASVVVMLGAGLFYSSRFAAQPPQNDRK